jgi:hypothetical protein
MAVKYDFEADMHSRQAAVTAAGWQGNAARVLMLRGDSPDAFASHMAEANALREVANMVRAQLTEAGVDVDRAIERSIIHALPLAEVRAIIVQRMAERDEATHTDTAQPVSAQAATGDIYAARREQMKATNGRR